MSSTPTEESVERTKQQIRSLVNEISELSKSDIEASEFYPSVLQRIVTALAAVGGAIWLLDQDGAMRLSYQIQIDPSLTDGNNEDALRHGRLLGRVMSQGRAELIPPNSSFGDQHEFANPTPYLLVMTPLLGGKQPSGVMEIFQRGDAQPDAQRGYLRFIEHMGKIISEWLKGQSLLKVSDRHGLLTSADQFARLVHDNLDLRDTAYTIANEGRRLIECDRVSVAVAKGRKARIKAISGQDTIENRSNIVSALNNLATRVIRSGEPLWYDGTTEDLPPQIEEAVEDYVDQSHGRTIAVLPIYRPEKTIEGDVLTARNVSPESRHRGPAIGALIVEQIETQLDRAALQSRVDLVYEHSCRALSNSMTHSNLFLMPLWKFLDRATWMFRGSALPKTLAILGLIAAAVVAAFLVPIDFDLKGNGQLQPISQKDIFAHVDGEIEEVYVTQGMMVQEGQPVVKMKNRDLEVEILNIRGQQAQAVSRLNSIEYSINKGIGSETERLQLQSEKAEVEQQLRNYERQLVVLMQKDSKLIRVSPITGVVTTWEVEKRLAARPVVTGQLLMNVADFSKEWEVEVYMPEKRMKHLDAAFKETDEDYLPCEFILKTDPENKRTGKLSRDSVHQRAEVHGEDGVAVKLRVIPDSMEGISRRPGAEVIADVKCGKRSFAWVWLYQPIEVIRTYLFF
ncbi:MAG: biotin/lipoyl-binding protein [Pirellulaceae bacterium]|nr:biotin/lipoyl-binding protein [Pirellulaceae bacterium]